MPSTQLIETLEFKFRNCYYGGWIEIKTHPRWRNIRFRYDIGTLDNLAELSNPIWDTNTPEFLEHIKRYNVDPPLWGWIPNTRWGTCHIRPEVFEDFKAFFIPYWEGICRTALAKVPGVEVVEKGE